MSRLRVSRRGGRRWARVERLPAGGSLLPSAKGQRPNPDVGATRTSTPADEFGPDRGSYMARAVRSRPAAGSEEAHDEQGGRRHHHLG